MVSTQWLQLQLLDRIRLPSVTAEWLHERFMKRIMVPVVQQSWVEDKTLEDLRLPVVSTEWLEDLYARNLTVPTVEQLEDLITEKLKLSQIYDSLVKQFKSCLAQMMLPSLTCFQHEFSEVLKGAHLSEAIVSRQGVPHGQSSVLHSYYGQVSNRTSGNSRPDFAGEPFASPSSGRPDIPLARTQQPLRHVPAAPVPSLSSRSRTDSTQAIFAPRPFRQPEVQPQIQQLLRGPEVQTAPIMQPLRRPDLQLARAQQPLQNAQFNPGPLKRARIEDSEIPTPPDPARIGFGLSIAETPASNSLEQRA